MIVAFIALLMTTFPFYSAFDVLAQTASAPALAQQSGLGNSGGGTVLIAIVSLAAGYITGLCIRREDRKRVADTETANAGLRARINQLQTPGK